MKLDEPVYFDVGNPDYKGDGFNGGWYVAKQGTYDPTDNTGEPDEYLHTDGVLRTSTMDMETEKYTGYFETEDAALLARLAYLENEK